MRWTLTCVLVFSFQLSALSLEARGEIKVLKANGTPVPAGSAVVTYNGKTDGWDVVLTQLYAPQADTVYEIHGNGGETIDNVYIFVDGPPAGSPLIIRVLGDAPDYVRTVHNIIQIGTAETLLNKVKVFEDIGSVQVEAVGDLIAGRDILGPITATTSDNSIRGITTAQAGRHILGDLTADHGRILLAWAQAGDIGTPGLPVTIRAKFSVYQVMGTNVYANINTRYNGGTGGFWALVADAFVGTLSTEKLILNQYNNVNGLILLHQQFSGTISIGKSFNNPLQYIQVPVYGLGGQIIINADNAAGGAWTAPVRVGPNGDPQQIILTNPNYPQTNALLGGGSVGLVPFHLHDEACIPANGQTAQVVPTGTPLTVQLRHYGPIAWNGALPVTIERRPMGSQAAFTPVAMSDFAAVDNFAGSNVLAIGPAPGKPGFAIDYQYRIHPTAALKCDVPSQPAVIWDADYIIGVVRPPCDGDINLDGIVNVNDLLFVINFWGPVSPQFPAADVNHDGMVNVNDLLIVINHWGLCW